MRLSADGSLLLCLGNEQGTDLRALLRAGRGESDLCAAISEAIRAKPWMHEFGAKPRKVTRITAQTGGWNGARLASTAAGSARARH
ncbi:MAG: hypothetical protein HY017_27060 [Betaproteobacteria bacterium]|nr:hypothetical protein [Betaproteobacteria bacterium]